MPDLEALGQGDIDLQAQSDVVAEVVSTEGEDPGVADGLALLEDEFGGTSSDVDDQGSVFFVFRGQDGLCIG